MGVRLQSADLPALQTALGCQSLWTVTSRAFGGSNTLEAEAAQWDQCNVARCGGGLGGGQGSLADATPGGELHVSAFTEVE